MPARALAPFIVAHVVSADKHPNADRLQVCMVDTGADIVQVVCGAPNARTGMKGVFARPASTFRAPAMCLKKGAIRGVESNGMLCSEREMRPVRRSRRHHRTARRRRSASVSPRRWASTIR